MNASEREHARGGSGAQLTRIVARPHHARGYEADARASLAALQAHTGRRREGVRTGDPPPARRRGESESPIWPIPDHGAKVTCMPVTRCFRSSQHGTRVDIDEARPTLESRERSGERVLTMPK